MEHFKRNNSDTVFSKYYYRNIDQNKNLQELQFLDYRFLYSELYKKDKFVYVDYNEEVNFIIKLESLNNLEIIFNNNKNMGITHSIFGPEIIISIKGISGGYSFVLNLESKKYQNVITRLINGENFNIHYLIEDNGLLIKLNTEVFKLEKNVIETLQYMLDFSISSSYPRIKYDNKFTYGYSLEVTGGVEIIEGILATVELLQKWESMDNFDIFLYRDKNLNIIFSEDIKNYNFFINELSRRFQIKENGKSNILGRPFLNYRNGLIFFYE